MNEPIEKTFTIDKLQIEEKSRQVVESILGTDSESARLVEALMLRVKNQKQNINKLEKDLTKSAKKLKSIKPGKEAQELKNQLLKAKQILEQEKQALTDLETQLTVMQKAVSELESIWKILKTKTERMKLTGQENSEAFAETEKLTNQTEKTLQELKTIMNKIGGIRHE